MTFSIPAVHAFQEIENRVVTPNFRQAEQYSSAYLRQFVYSTSVTPNWIDKTDEFWYSYKTSLGTQYWRVNPEKNTRLPLFDHYKLASQLSELTRKPVEPSQLALSRVELKNETDTLTFVSEEKLFEYTLKSEILTDKGPAPRETNRGRTGGRRRGQDREEQEREEQEREEQEREEQQREEQQKQEQQKQEVVKKDEQQETKKDGEKNEDVNKEDGKKEDVKQEDVKQEEKKEEEKKDEVKREEDGRGEANDRSATPSTRADAHRVFAPDRKSYVFAKGHDLYWVQIPEPDAKTDEAPTKLPGENKQAEVTDSKSTDKQGDQEKQDEQKSDGKAKKEESLEGKKSEDKKTEKAKEDANSKKEEVKDSEGSPSVSSQPIDLMPFDSLQETEKQEVQKEETVQQEETKKTDKKQDGKQEEDKVVTQEESKKDKKEESKEESKVEKKEDAKEDKKEDKREEKKEDVKEDQKEEQKEDKKVEKQDETREEKKQDDGTQDKKEPEAEKKPEAVKFNPKWDELAVRLTDDGAENYTFAGAPTTRGQSREIKEDTLTRPSVTWAEDSKSFYVNRRDSRGVKDLWVINSLTDPRPSLEQYPYPMPGEENIRKSELYFFHADSKSLSRVKPRWKDESYSDVRFNEDHSQLRFLRRDRLLRNVELCSLTLTNGEITSLFEEGFEQATIAPKGLRYLENKQEMIWWSERSGWGHFYLYDADGKLKNPITSGSYIANRIVELDEENRILYFEGLGREPGENLNYSHLYSVRLDGGDLKLLNPGDANHSSALSPTKRFLVDNYSRVDLAPASVLRGSDGQEIMKLEEADLSRLHQVGWQIPETFVVKAADGVTDLFGNMYKPFNFDPNKKYPIITYVYPGPQQEGTRHTFTATAGEQQLAQIGFIVIQVGHRGGTPGRSKAYASYGYFNLRDYALDDKKTAIEQLAQRFSFIDVERVGIYGHSGGGFMTAAALMVPPYNDFFKAGFSTAGNHDNNIYNNSWSERWHGLKEVPIEEETASTRQEQSRERTQQRSGPSDLKARLSVDPEDFFYDYEMANNEDQWDLDRRMWGEEEPLPLWLQDQVVERQREQELQEEQQRTERQEGQTERGQERRQQRGGRRGQQRRQDQENDSQRGNREQNQEEQDGEKKNLNEEKENDEKEKGKEKETDGEKQVKDEKDVKQDEQDEDQERDQETKEVERKTRFEIRVPSNAELAENLKHHLFLVHGELDNNVHPANTLRLVDALIKANKRFDMMYLPGTRHGFGSYQPYVTQRMFEFFAERLLSDYQAGADMKQH